MKVHAAGLPWLTVGYLKGCFGAGWSGWVLVMVNEMPYTLVIFIWVKCIEPLEKNVDIRTTVLRTPNTSNRSFGRVHNRHWGGTLLIKIALHRSMVHLIFRWEMDLMILHNIMGSNKVDRWYEMKKNLFYFPEKMMYHNCIIAL